MPGFSWLGKALLDTVAVLAFDEHKIDEVGE